MAMNVDDNEFRKERMAYLVTAASLLSPFAVIDSELSNNITVKRR